MTVVRTKRGDTMEFLTFEDDTGIEGATMKPNPYDPRNRKNLTENERRAMHFMQDCLHGDDEGLIDRYVAEDYI